MQKIQQNSRLLLRGANGRIYGELVNRTLYKRVFASRHFLRKPVPAIAIDAELYDRYRTEFDEIQVADAETGRTYFLPAKLFDRYRWTLERGYGKQYAVALRYWTVYDPHAKQEQLALDCSPFLALKGTIRHDSAPIRALSRSCCVPL